MTSKKHEKFEHDVKLDVEARVRQGVKAVLGERNGHYQRNLVTPADKIERLEVSRDREGEFARPKYSSATSE